VGKSVELTPENPPSSTSFFLAEWDFNSNGMTLDKLTLGDSGKYTLRVTLINAGGILTGETSLQVFGECFAKTWFSIYCKIISW